MKSNRIFQVEEIETYIRQKNFGDTVKINELQQFTNYNLKDKYEYNKFKSSLMKIVKNNLIQKGIVLKAIQNVGYYILKPNQVQSYTYRTYIVKPLKHFEKAEIILSKTNKSLLNKQELDKHKLTQELNYDLLALTGKLIENEKYRNLE